MARVMKNFRAVDMLASDGSEVEENVTPTPEPEPTPDPDDGSESSDDPNVQPTTAQSASSDVPTGSVADVMDWVGDDPDKAQQAYDAEFAKAKPRATLIEQLNSVLSGESRA